MRKQRALVLVSVACAALLVSLLLLHSRSSNPQGAGSAIARREQGKLSSKRTRVEVEEDVKGALLLAGVVVDDQEQPVAGAVVRLSPSNRTVTTGDDGAFEFDQLAPRRYQLRAVHGDSYAGPVTVRLRVGAEDHVTLRMQQGATLRLRVVGDRAPIAGAQVTLGVLVSVGRHATITTGEDGVATISGLGPEYQDIRVVADGWAPGFLYAFLEEDPGGVVERTITLKRGARVEGVVLGPGGKPVPDAEVVFWNAPQMSWYDETRTDSTGAWHFDAVVAGAYKVFASSKAFAEAEELAIELDGVMPRKNVVVRVQDGGQLRGTVVDAKGVVVSDAKVEAVLRGERTYDERTVADGTFALVGMKVGTYDVIARKEGRASAAQRVALENGKRGDLKFVLEDSAIAGTVVDEAGVPVPDVTVSASAIDRFSTTSSVSDITDSRGAFDLGGLELGEYDVVATWSNQYGTRAARSDREERSKQRVRTNNTNVRLIVAAFGTITGRVVFEAKPMTYYGILLTNEPSFPENGQSPTGVRTDDGKFTLRNVGVGTWGLVLLGSGTAIKTLTDLEVQPGSTLDLGDITLQRGQRISGRVRDASGAVVADARVLIGRGLEPDGTRLKQWFGGSFETNTDSGGFFKFEGIAAHRDYMRPPQIYATHYKHGASLIRDLPKGDAEVEMTLIGVGSIDGVVDGAVERFAWVYAQRTDEPDQARGTLVDSLGRFFFEDIPAGEYRIVVEGRAGTAAASTNVTVVANQRAKAKKLTIHTGSVEGER